MNSKVTYTFCYLEYVQDIFPIHDVPFILFAHFNCALVHLKLSAYAKMIQSLFIFHLNSLLSIKYLEYLKHILVEVLDITLWKKRYR